MKYKKTIIFAWTFLAFAILTVILTTNVVAECCLNQDIQGGLYYCKGPEDGVGEENCCGSGISCPPDIYTIESCQDVSVCNSAVLGCCCAGASGIPVRKDTCESLGWIFNQSIQDPSSCTSFCQTVGLSQQCSPDSWDLTLEHTRGKSEIKIHISTCNPVPPYTISRCLDDVCEDIVVDSQSTGEHIDYVEWDKDYVYEVKSGGVLVAFDSIFSGNVECLNHFNDNKFCFPSEYYVRQQDLINYDPFLGTTDYDVTVNERIGNLSTFSFNLNNAPVYCNYENKIVSGGSQCTTGSCVIDSNNNEPMCLKDSDCQNSTTNEPFGMFFTQQSCEYTPNNEKKYCFHDKSETTVDYCYDCNPKINCADYKSKQACTTDSCFLNRCSWVSTNDEMDTGVCIEQNSGENCAWCTKEGTEGMQNKDAFNKIFDTCSADKASALSTSFGYCVFLPGQDGTSRSCSDMACTDYDESYCAGFTPISLDVYNYVNPASNDPCNIGVCEWFPTGIGYCGKDANIDNANDCGLGDRSCNLDYFKPSSEIVPIKFYKGCPVNFSITIDDKTKFNEMSKRITNTSNYKTYVCAGTLCKDSLFRSDYTEKTIMKINGLKLSDGEDNLLNLLEGQNTLYYYTKDPADNIGIKKNISIYASEDCSYIEYKIEVK